MNKFLKKLSAGVLLGFAAIPASHAALTAEATAAIGEVSTAVSDNIAGWWPVMALAMGGLIGFKLFKKFGNRAT